jgi:RluA family pseudouridine synthase
VTIPILWSSPGLVAVDKPAGISVVPGRQSERGPSLREVLERQLGRRVWVVHRLDRDTTGVLLFALDADSHRAANRAFEQGRVQKRYLALVSPPLASARTVDLALVPARRSRMRPVRPGESGKPAVTEFRPVETLGEVQLVEAVPLTGRTHQIRIHLLAAGAPLLVDPQYRRPEPFTGAGQGLDSVTLSRTPLHASRLFLEHSADLPRMEVSAPLPEDMASVLEVLRQRTKKGAETPV